MLTPKEVGYILSGPDRAKSEGMRDYPPIIVMLHLPMRVSEVCSLRVSSVKWNYKWWKLRCKVKGGREEVWPLSRGIKEAIDHYLKLDRQRRELAHSGTEHAPPFQLRTNYRTLEFDRVLTPRMVQKIVKKWANYSRRQPISSRLAADGNH